MSTDSPRDKRVETPTKRYRTARGGRRYRAEVTRVSTTNAYVSKLLKESNELRARRKADAAPKRAKARITEIEGQSPSNFPINEEIDIFIIPSNSISHDKIRKIRKGKLASEVFDIAFNAGKLTQKLTDHGVDTTELLDATEAFKDAETFKSQSQSNSSPSSQDPISTLIDHSGNGEIEALSQLSPEEVKRRRKTVAAKTFLRNIKSFLSDNAAADVLGISLRTLQIKATEGELVAIRWHDLQLYPKWQFRDGNLMPGLSEISDSLREANLHPVDVNALMETPTDALSGYSPVNYLWNGGNPDNVNTLIDAAGWL